MRRVLKVARRLIVALLAMAACYSILFLRAGLYDQQGSYVLAEMRSFAVYLPAGYNSEPEKQYPVVYSLDGEKDRHSAIMAANARLLASLGLAPEVILVAVNTNGMRGRDYRPSIGAEFFTKYLKTELMPHVARNFRTSGKNVISGHSHGGLYAVYAFANHPGLFNAHFAYVPSLYYEPQLLKSLQTRLEEPEQKGTSLFLYSGFEGKKFWNSFNETVGLLKSNTNNSVKWQEGFFPLPHPLIMLPGQMQALSSLPGAK